MPCLQSIKGEKKLKKEVRLIPKEQTHEWLLKKHYAHRIPSISYAYGLYIDNVLSGVCTFGMPANYIEMEAWRPFGLLELNRLIVNESLPSNSLSYFVGKALKLLPKPRVIISYSDITNGHHGYIYQATNWIYTGIGGENQWILKDGSVKCRRHHEAILPELIESIVNTQKARYYYFVGSKGDKIKMKTKLRYPILPYPKGDNKRYDASYNPPTQEVFDLS